MATIKSYTDISQSKTLSKILSLESADMHYVATYVSPSEGIVEYRDIPELGYSKPYTPCWSLAALLGVLPRKVELEDTAYTIGVSLDSINYSNVNNGNLLLEVKVKDNLVDACYEVIIKLYELKML
jgi:hypothetical protein